MFWIGIFILFLLCLYLFTPYPSLSRNFREEELKTGDLLFFCGPSLSEGIIRWAIRCEYSHVAMVYVSGGVTYLWEADYGQNRKEGPRLIPLRDKLAYFRKRSSTQPFLRRYRGPTISEEEMDPIIEKYFNSRMSFAGYIHVDDSSEYEGVCCSTLLAFTLKDLGLFDGNPNQVSPRTLLREFSDLYE